MNSTPSNPHIRSASTEIHFLAHHVADQEERRIALEQLIAQIHKVLGVIDAEISPQAPISGLVSDVYRELGAILNALEPESIKEDGLPTEPKRPTKIGNALSTIGAFCRKVEPAIQTWRAMGGAPRLDPESTIIAARAYVVDVRKQPQAWGDRTNFYSNLVFCPLYDYGEYLGWQRRREETDYSVAELAKESTYPEYKIERVMSFHHLPREAHHLLATNPSRMTAESAATFNALIRAGRLSRVLVAIQALSEDMTLDEEDAIRIAESPENYAAAMAHESSLLKKNGKIWAELCRCGGEITLTHLDADRETQERYFAELVEFIEQELM